MKIWEEPYNFNPDRFKNITNFKNNHFYPFGYGVITCICNNLALNEVKIVMSNLIKKYKILPVIGFKQDIYFGIY
jgi:cytochrome P450